MSYLSSLFILLSLFRFFLCDKIISTVIRDLYEKVILYGLGSSKEDYHNTLGISSQFFTLGLDSIYSFVNDEEYRNKSASLKSIENTLDISLLELIRKIKLIY